MHLVVVVTSHTWFPLWNGILSCIARYAAIDTFIGAWGRGLNTREVGRTFFLAITPRAFVGAVSAISHMCRPNPPVTFRVVLEKPFGRDLDSARELAQEVWIALCCG